MDMISAGDAAPAFCLQDPGKSEVCLDSFRGRWLVLYFYPKDNTSGCTLEAKGFSESAGSFSDLNAVIVGVSPDSCESHEKFMKKHSLELVLLSDPLHEVLGKYGVWQKKKLYGKEYFGVVRTTYLIDPEGKIAWVWPKVKVAGHAGAVREKITELSGFRSGS